MGTNFPELFMALGRDFHPSEIKTRSQGGRNLRYVTARTIMNRLDEVLGPENWWDEYTPLENSVVCRLSIRLPDGTVITKVDAGGVAGMQDPGDDDKSAYSDSLKRAAVKFLVGRYLYNDGVPALGDDQRGGNTGAAQRSPMVLPPPRGVPAPPPPEPVRSRHQPAPPIQNGRQPSLTWPKAGTKQVFAFLKGLEEVTGESVITGIGRYAKERGWDWKKETWTQEMVDEVLIVAIESLKQADSYQGQLDGLDMPNPLQEARKQLVSAANKVLEDMGYETSPTTIKQLLESLSPGVANGAGHTGQVMESIKNCTDLVWLQNMTAEVSRTAHDTAPAAAENAQEDEEAPF